MNAELLCILAALAVQTNAERPITFQTATPVYLAALRGDDTSAAAIARAQTAAGYDEDPPSGAPQAQTYVPPADAAQAPQWNPFAATPTYPSDPFMGQPPDGSIGGAPFGGQSFGVNGPQPYQLNRWLSRYDAGYIFQENTKGIPGNFSVTEANVALRYSTLWPGGVIFSWTPEVNSRSWSGPSGVPLPGQVWRAASDFELAIAGNCPVTLQLGFTPAIVSDFKNSLSRDAYNYDGRAALIFQSSPQLTIVVGALYWNRVRDLVLPYAGVTWRPDDQWEFQLMFPKSRISYFLGNSPWGVGTWLYGSAEYCVEDYQINIVTTDMRDRIELADYRLMLGLRSAGKMVTSFVEGGWVVDRHVRFQNNSNANFGIQDGGIIRAGIRF